MESPNARSLKLLRKHGFRGDNVERRNRFVAHDFLGCVDLIGIRAADRRTLAVQATSWSNRSTRIRKVLDSEDLTKNMVEWILAGNEFEVWAWKKSQVPTKKGGEKTLWVVGRDLFAVCSEGVGLVVTRDDSGFK